VTETLVINDYDPEWPVRFAAEALRLRKALGDLIVRIEHTGSTSVPGLGAKPIVDIQVSVEKLEPRDDFRAALEGLGYVFFETPDDAVYPFFHTPAGWPHLYHVHVCEAGGEEERRHLAFRDYLRDHPEAASEYEALKRRLASRHLAEDFESRSAYSEAKSSFIRPCEARAMAEGYPREA
jgi:GrpB-like predicted nucleotidyltransferase (UPF0157 family)